MSRFRYGVVSSLGPDGGPQSAIVGIATTPELEIVFDTVRSSRKYPNLVARPACSFVVGGWSSEQTVQFEGLAVEPVGEELERCREAYFTVWPDGRERLKWAGLTHFVVRPTWIRYSDFDQSPPVIQEFMFPR
jgi:pyridoxine/pyridoxamine 5'-phosphate oxidase